MPTTHYLQVSSHGQDTQQGTFHVPDGCTFKFFVKVGAILDYKESIEIYEEFAAADTDKLNARDKHTIFETGKVENYALWNLGDDQYVSGVLKLNGPGSTTTLVRIDETQQHPVFFNDVIDQALAALKPHAGDEVIVYFNACRAR